MDTINKISREEFLNLSEDNVMFITNPGRMGDEDGTTFIIRNENEYTIYRIDGWMYPNKEKDIISLEDTANQFPKWYETWKHCDDKDYKGKYTHIYMGFGNGLSIDNSIYNEYEPYLNKLVEEDLKGKSKEEKESLKYATIYKLWKLAFIKMINDKKIK